MSFTAHTTAAVHINRAPATPDCTVQCMNYAPAILTAPALIFSMHRVLVIWIIVAHFHICTPLGTLSRYAVLEA